MQQLTLYSVVRSKTSHTRRAFKDGGSFLRFKFIYICIPCARGRLLRAMNNPTALLISSSLRPAHPFRSDSAPRVTSLRRVARPRAHPLLPRGNSLLRNSSIRPFYTSYRSLMAEMSETIWVGRSAEKSRNSFFWYLSQDVITLFISLLFRRKRG